MMLPNLPSKGTCTVDVVGPHKPRQGALMQLNSHDGDRPAAAALDILDERFARGEIDKAEYLEKKQLISHRVPVPKADRPGQTPVAPQSTATLVKRSAQRR